MRFFGSGRGIVLPTVRCFVSADAELFIDKFAGGGIVAWRIRLSDRMACGSLGAANLLCVNILAHIFDQAVIFRLCRSKFFVIDKRQSKLLF